MDDTKTKVLKTVTGPRPPKAAEVDDPSNFQEAKPLPVEEWAKQFETLPDCPTEDSTNCKWDAKNMGNGKGTSFVSLNNVNHYEDGTMEDYRVNGKGYPN